LRVDPVAAAGFGAAADLYERARPSYPQAAVDWLIAECGIGRTSTVVDLGAGTGKLTRLLVPSGARVVAVEPIAEMRAHIDGAEVLDGTAEDVPLPDRSADVVTVAQAFHWFDHDRALPEIHRVLRDDGRLALVWNMRDLEDPLQGAVEDLLRPIRSEVPAQALGAWRVPLERSSLFGQAVVGKFRYAQQFTAEDLCDRVASTSFVATMTPVDREELLVRVRALAAELEEPFPFRYLTEVHLIPRTSDRGRDEGGTSIKG
jgi:SAM-dependent methyltransferase